MRGRGRFWRFVDKSGKCWVWTGHTTRGKPLVFGIGRMSAQMFALQDTWDQERRGWKIHPSGTINMRCGNPLCVRPAHMRTANIKKKSADEVRSRTKAANAVRYRAQQIHKKARFAFVLEQLMEVYGEADEF